MTEPQLPITKRPCSNCPFRADADAIELRPGRLNQIVEGLVADDHQTFVCHKTLDGQRQTCAGAVAFLDKLGCLPVIARLALAFGHIERADIDASRPRVIEPEALGMQAVVPEYESTRPSK